MVNGLAPGVVVLVSILAAAAVVAMAAAIHKVYSSRGAVPDPEATDAMIMNISNEQAQYMRDVRMRNQIQSWGVAPAFEDAYQAPRSQVARPLSRGGDTTTSWG